MKMIFAAAAILITTAPTYAQVSPTARSTEVENGRAPASTLPPSSGSPDASEATQRGQNKPTVTGGQPGGAADRN